MSAYCLHCGGQMTPAIEADEWVCNRQRCTGQGIIKIYPGVTHDIKPLDELAWPRRTHEKKPPPPTVPELLRGAATTYEERNKVYGDNYKQYGLLMAALYPKGIHIDPKDIGALNRLGLIQMIAAKLSRFTMNPRGYHKDSAHDGAVYFAMLEELTPGER